MARSLKKGPFCDPKLLKKIDGMPAGSRSIIKTWSRSSTIFPELVGFTFGVHNGKTFINVTVVEEMVGHKFGEFSPTRKFRTHGGKMAKDQAKSAGAPKVTK